MKYVIIMATDSMIHIPGLEKSVLAFRNDYMGYTEREREKERTRCFRRLIQLFSKLGK
jgi:hypothetical protein